jgi:uncharacterized alkaline shock family protein YloU
MFGKQEENAMGEQDKQDKQDRQERKREDRMHISEEVIETIVGIEASKVDGVAALSGTFADGIAGVLGRKSIRKGVKVQLEGEKASVDVSIIVDYGCKIHEVSKNIQARVRETVRCMTGMEVTDIIVNVVGINIKDESLKMKAADKMREETGQDSSDCD